MKTIPKYTVSNYRDLLKSHGIENVEDAEICAAIHEIGVLSTPEETDSAVVQSITERKAMK